MTRFATSKSGNSIVSDIESKVAQELRMAYPDVPVSQDDDLMDFMLHIVAATGQRFVCIIDEWDAVCRDNPPGSEVMDSYVNWLRRMFKDTSQRPA